MNGGGVEEAVVEGYLRGLLGDEVGLEFEDEGNGIYSTNVQLSSKEEKYVLTVTAKKCDFYVEDWCLTGYEIGSTKIPFYVIK